jgi:hypothetical protein
MPEGIRVRGYVMGYPHSLPIRGAHVRIGSPPKDTFTDAAGLFCVYVPAGEHAITVAAQGWEQRTLDVLVYSPMRVDFLLRRVK